MRTDLDGRTRSRMLTRGLLGDGGRLLLQRMVDRCAIRGLAEASSGNAYRGVPCYRTRVELGPAHDVRSVFVTTVEEISALTRPNHPDDWTELDSQAVD